MRDVAFIVLYMIPLTLSFGRIFVCVLNWAWISVLGPTSFLFGFAVSVPWNKLVAVVTALSFLISKERRLPRVNSIGVCVILFLCIAAIAQFNAISYADLGWSLLDKLWKIVALYFLVATFATSADRIHALVITACLATGFMAVDDGLKFVASAGHYHPKGTGAWGDNNSEGLLILMGMPLLTYLRAVSTHPTARLGATLGLVLSVLAVIATASRGATVGLAVLAIAAIAASRHKLGYSVLIGLGALALLVLAPEDWMDRMRTIGSAGEDGSFMTRVIAWKMSILLAIDNPFGGGLHAVQIAEVWSKLVPQFGRMSFIPSPEPEGMHAAHSIYFEVLGDTGFGGLVVFLVILGSTLIGLRRTSKRTKLVPELNWASVLAWQLQLSLVAYLVSGAALSEAYLDMPWLILGLSNALRALVAESVRQLPSRRAGMRRIGPNVAPAPALARTTLPAPIARARP